MAVVIKKVGVIGSGQMGNGIAHVAALAGLDVVLNDLSADRLKSAMATINARSPRRSLPRTPASRRSTASFPAKPWTGSRTAIW
jgi:3-hydroxyacyl-CoA dehydrogenase